MNVASRVASLTTLLILAVGTLGCNGDTVARENNRRKKLDEQKAILAYSSEVPKVDAKLKAFVKTWDKVNKLNDVKAHQEAWRTALLPALQGYIKALGEMPLGTAGLKRIHAIVLTSYQAAMVPFKAYPEGLTEKNRTERSKKILAALKAVTKADVAYKAELGKYYKANGVTLKAKK